MNFSRLLTMIILAATILIASNALAKTSIWVLDVKGAIGPATADYIVQGIDTATEAKADLIVLRIDTPGGLDLSMRVIIKKILASEVPFATYVSPNGARAASAGTYILYASHIAAMAPATNLGAATPVQIGAPSIPSPTDTDDKPSGPPAKSAMEKKIINDAVAYIEGLAKLNNRNIEWAVEAVREGSSLSATDALEINVIDYIAKDLDSLMSVLDGKIIQTESEEITLNTSDVVYTFHEPGWRNEFLSVITNPNIAYILMLAGVYGLLFEFYSPGAIVPGVIGGISLILALYAFQLLPVSYAGLGLIALGIALMVAEALSPSFGALGLGGIVAFIVGSIILIDTDIPAFRIALPLIFALALTSAALLVLMIGMVLRSRTQKVVSGLAPLVDSISVVESVNDQHILVRLQGELWQVTSDDTLKPGDYVRIVSTEGIFLRAVREEG